MTVTMRMSIVFSALAVLSIVAGCDDDDGASTAGGEDAGPVGMDDAGTPGGEDAGTEAMASVRVIHLSPTAPAVDVFVNDGADAVVSGLAFPEGTGYLEVPAATYTFDVAAAGSSEADAVLTIEDLALAGDTFYTAVAFDELARIDALALVDDYSGLADGDIRIRAVHAAPAVGEVDIWNVPESGDPSPLYENVPFGVAGDALDVPAAAYTLGFDVDDDATPDVIFDVPALEAGTVANVFATNDDAGNVFLIAQLGDGTTVRIDPTE